MTAQKANKPKTILADTPVGRRKVICDCNDEYDPLDENTECFDDGPHAVQCSACGKYPWYRIKATVGSSNRKPLDRPSMLNKTGRKNNVKIAHDGKSLTVAEWSRATGIVNHTIYKRIRCGWDLARAITEPVDVIKSRASAKYRQQVCAVTFIR